MWALHKLWAVQLRSQAAGILGIIRATCIVFLLPKSFQGTCSRFQWWSRDMEVPPVWGVPTASEGHLGLVSFLHFGHCEIHTGFMAQVLSIRIHKYSRIYSNILSDRREIHCYKTCSLFFNKKTSYGWSQRCNLKYSGSLVSWVFSVIGVCVCLPGEHPKSIGSHGSGFFCLSVFWFVCCFFGCVSERYARGEGIVSILHLRLVPCHWPSLCTFVKHL